MVRRFIQTPSDPLEDKQPVSCKQRGCKEGWERIRSRAEQGSGAASEQVNSLVPLCPSQGNAAEAEAAARHWPEENNNNKSKA